MLRIFETFTWYGLPGQAARQQAAMSVQHEPARQRGSAAARKSKRRIGLALHSTDDSRQKEVCPPPRRDRLAAHYIAGRQPDAQGETRHLAATVLGACDSGRARLASSSRLHPLQPGQARACGTGHRLAVFFISSLCGAWRLSRELGCVTGCSGFCGG
jgi:hypothetical protein